MSFLGQASDVVIVGGGLSGLASALHLLDLRVTKPSSITILEGRSRVGGRLQAHEGVDVGGAWCWTSAHQEVPALAQRFGVASFDQYDDGLNVIDYGDSVARTRSPFDGTKVRFEGGAAAITNTIANHVCAKGVNIQLDCTTNRISTAHGDAVRVEGIKAGKPVSWLAKAVFLAIPPRLALPPLMTWEPSLPPALLRSATATPTWMAETTKVLITYSRPFWREMGLSGNVMSYGAGPIQQLYDSSGPSSSAGPHALCGFVFGNGAQQPPPDDALRPQVLKQLERVFGVDAKSPLSFSSHRWGDQPLTSANGGGAGGGHGSMGDSELRKPFVSVRMVDHNDTGAGPAGGPSRVWLSAAETDEDHGGLMEGALLAGRRVVEQAIRSGALAKLDADAADEACSSGQSSP